MLGGAHRQAAFSLVEIVLAIALVAAVAIPVLDALGSVRAGVTVTKKRSGAVFLGQAILENVRYQLYCFGPHVPEGAPREPERLEAVRVFFQSLEDEGAVVSAAVDGGQTVYFAGVENLQGSGLHGITREMYPSLYPRLADYRCEVQAILNSPSADADGDGTPEPDLCEVRVTLYWPREQDGGEASLTLWTMITSRRHGNAT